MERKKVKAIKERRASVEQINGKIGKEKDTFN